MKNLIFILSIFIFSFSFSQNKSADTAQVVIPNKVNSTFAKEKPYLILISTDGFRYDYAKKYNAENLLKFSNQGVSAKAMLPSFPSITFPNHWSLITGLYPSHHGLVDNFFYDYSRKEFYAMSKKENAEDGSWYGGVPLWSLAEKQGVVSASLQ
jgi:predicted AlkP superfamily pyrophosphatase or phosphodiesterase